MEILKIGTHVHHRKYGTGVLVDYDTACEVRTKEDSAYPPRGKLYLDRGDKVRVDGDYTRLCYIEDEEELTALDPDMLLYVEDNQSPIGDTSFHIGDWIMKAGLSQNMIGPIVYDRQEDMYMLDIVPCSGRIGGGIGGAYMTSIKHICLATKEALQCRPQIEVCPGYFVGDRIVVDDKICTVIPWGRCARFHITKREQEKGQYVSFIWPDGKHPDDHIDGVAASTVRNLTRGGAPELSRNLFQPVDSDGQLLFW